MEKLNLFFQKFNLKTVLWSAALLTLLCDVMNIGYIRELIRAKQMIYQTIELALRMQGLSRAEMDPLLLTQLHVFAGQSIRMMLATFLIVNLFFLIAMGLKKKWAYLYVKNYAYAGAAITVIMVVTEGFPLGGWWEAGNLTATVGYLLVGLMLAARRADFA